VNRIVRPFHRIADRFGVGLGELGCLAVIVLTGAVLRLVNLAARGGWDSDQALDMMALRTAVNSGQLPALGPQASWAGGTFHHGALFYDMFIPAYWLGNGDPTAVVFETALAGLIVVPIVWWIARSIGGTAAGLTAALLAAVSASLIGFSTFIWNPTPVEPGAALAFLGAWQAWRTRRPWWWLVAAAGTAVAMQAHITAVVIVLPMTAAFLVALRRGPAGGRRRIVAWGLVGATLVVATYLPLIIYELSHNFVETRGILSYFTGPSTTPGRDPFSRLFFAAIRILAWPLTRWPMVDLVPSFLPALTVAFTLAFGMIWRLMKTGGGARSDGAGGATGATLSAGIGPDSNAGQSPTPASAIEAEGTRFVGACLLLLILALGLGVHAVSEVQELPTEQYHVVADPLVLVATGLVIGGLWRAMPRRWPAWSSRALAILGVAALVAWNAGHWPPLTAPDGGWPAAQAAATRLERDAAGTSLSVVPLFVDKGISAYEYPLERDGVVLVEPAGAATVVLLCDSLWLDGCGGSQEEAWVSRNAAGQALHMCDRFWAAPDRLLTVYRRGVNGQAAVAVCGP
jgi:4-amino-4-deoxy-L-arabinose transferase-like glycosyltransferase